eukprot:6679687-Pyramimonas_sp.AAC.1
MFETSKCARAHLGARTCGPQPTWPALHRLRWAGEACEGFLRSAQLQDIREACEASGRSTTNLRGALDGLSMACERILSGVRGAWHCGGMQIH